MLLQKILLKNVFPSTKSRDIFAYKKYTLWAKKFYNYCTLNLNYLTSKAGTTCKRRQVVPNG